MKHYEVMILVAGEYAVVENTSHGAVVIKRFSTVTPARRFAAKLNKGQGFGGWTPFFMIDRGEEVG